MADGNVRSVAAAADCRPVIAGWDEGPERPLKCRLMGVSPGEDTERNCLPACGRILTVRPRSVIDRKKGTPQRGDTVGNRKNLRGSFQRVDEGMMPSFAEGIIPDSIHKGFPGSTLKSLKPSEKRG